MSAPPERDPRPTEAPVAAPEVPVEGVPSGFPAFLRRHRWLDLVALVALTLVAHAGALLDTEFTYDDVTIVASDARLELRTPADVGRVLLGSYWGEAFAGERLYRPIPRLTYALERTLWGTRPDPAHWVNLLLHLATIALVLDLLRALLRSRWAALLGAALFAAQPLHAEATAGIVGRAEVLGLALTLVALRLHRWARAHGDAPRGFALAAFTFLLAFGSKESALTGPFLLALLEGAAVGAFARPSLRRAWPYALYALALGVYFVARLVALGAITSSS
ncbi:MAG: hypothetical protein KDD82_04315, partial [Planctomycetes bacterium]|nr:hypothetical protein [Planctomycetota bacterium]